MQLSRCHIGKTSPGPNPPTPCHTPNPPHAGGPAGVRKRCSSSIESGTAAKSALNVDRADSALMAECAVCAQAEAISPCAGRSVLRDEGETSLQ